MTASKDTPDGRPPSQNRPFSGFLASSLPARQYASRPHSHSFSLGQINQSHRINRRKSSISVNGVNMAALAAAAQEASLDTSGSDNQGPSADLVHNPSTVGALASSTTGTFPSSTNDPKAQRHAFGAKNTIAVVDGPSLSSFIGSGSRARARRASEGSRLSKSERIRSSNGDMRCETCGKGYKHGSCLTKHLWEHTPEWSLTSKLLISKHQQVQLLEAASVLVNMNQGGTAAVETLTQPDHAMSSDSPAASGSSDPRYDDDMSSRTSTPSQGDDVAVDGKVMHFARPRRQDSYSSTFSHSYQSGSSGVNDNTLAHYRQWTTGSGHSGDSSQVSQYDSDEQADVTAAAEGLLSCSLGNAKNNPPKATTDVPPVPPLPAKFAKHRELSSSGFRPKIQQPAVRQLSSGYRWEVDMNDVAVRSYDDDDGVFGRMEN